jgi:hypothetical protein
MPSDVKPVAEPEVTTYQGQGFEISTRKVIYDMIAELV